MGVDKDGFLIWLENEKIWEDMKSRKGDRRTCPAFLPVSQWAVQQSFRNWWSSPRPRRRTQGNHRVSHVQKYKSICRLFRWAWNSCLSMPLSWWQSWRLRCNMRLWKTVMNNGEGRNFTVNKPAIMALVDAMAGMIFLTTPWVSDQVTPSILNSAALAAAIL